MSTTTLHEGDSAPTFEALSDSADTVRLEGERGRRVVLYFFPRADTPG